MIIDDFLKQMTIYFPTIKKDLDEHIQEFGERLDTIVIEDIIMPEIIELLEKDADTKKLKVIFDYFEDVCINSDDYLNNVFSITALEILGNDKNILEHAGSISHKLAMQKVADEYDKYKVAQKQLEHLESIKELEQDVQKLREAKK